jgi:hypothetical protein
VFAFPEDVTINTRFTAVSGAMAAADAATG